MFDYLAARGKTSSTAADEYHNLARATFLTTSTYFNSLPTYRAYANIYNPAVSTVLLFHDFLTSAIL